MAGLLDMQRAQGMNAEGDAVDDMAGPQPDDRSTQETGDEGDEQPNVTPEEQAIYDKAMENALRLIYDGEDVRPEILSALKAGDSDAAQDEKKVHILALAQAAVTVVGQLDQSSQQAKAPIPDEILAHVGQAVVEELGEVMEAAKIADLSEEDLNGAFYMALDMYRDRAIQSGRTTPDTLKQQFGQIQEADRAGELGSNLSGLSSLTTGDDRNSGAAQAQFQPNGLQNPLVRPQQAPMGSD